MIGASQPGKKRMRHAIPPSRGFLRSGGGGAIWATHRPWRVITTSSPTSTLRINSVSRFFASLTLTSMSTIIAINYSHFPSLFSPLPILTPFPDFQIHPDSAQLPLRLNSPSMATIPDLRSDLGLPANIDAEKTILGAILLDNTAHSEAAEKLVPDDFSLDSHRRIFLRMSELMDDQHAVDIVTLANELSRFKEVESVGGVAYLASLTEGLPRRPVIEEYIRIVKDKSLLRKLMGICSLAIARAADQGESALDVLGAAEADLMRVTESGLSGGLQPLDQIVANSFGTIDNLYKQSREVTGLATDFIELDRMMSGLQKGELIIIAARPSMGKTAFAINMAQNAAVNHGATVAVFSLEMSKESLPAVCSRPRPGSTSASCRPASSMAKIRSSCRMHWANWWSRNCTSMTRQASRCLKCAQKPAVSGRPKASST